MRANFGIKPISTTLCSILIIDLWSISSEPSYYSPNTAAFTSTSMSSVNPMSSTTIPSLMNIPVKVPQNQFQNLLEGEWYGVTATFAIFNFKMGCVCLQCLRLRRRRQSRCYSIWTYHFRHHLAPLQCHSIRCLRQCKRLIKFRRHVISTWPLYLNRKWILSRSKCLEMWPFNSNFSINQSEVSSNIYFISFNKWMSSSFAFPSQAPLKILPHSHTHLHTHTHMHSHSTHTHTLQIHSHSHSIYSIKMKLNCAHSWWYFV